MNGEDLQPTARASDRGESAFRIQRRRAGRRYAPGEQSPGSGRKPTRWAFVRPATEAGLRYGTGRRVAMAIEVEPGLREGLERMRDLLDAGNLRGAHELAKELAAAWPESKDAAQFASLLAPPEVRVRDDPGPSPDHERERA